MSEDGSVNHKANTNGNLLFRNSGTPAPDFQSEPVAHYSVEPIEAEWREDKVGLGL